MAEKKRRIHHLAKELLVKSKTIIEKCRAEGIEVKNHMHVVSAGLEATIKEWFSEGMHTTTLEEAQRVDLKSVKLKPKKRKAKPKVAAEATTSETASKKSLSAVDGGSATAAAVMEVGEAISEETGSFEKIDVPSEEESPLGAKVAAQIAPQVDDTNKAQIESDVLPPKEDAVKAAPIQKDKEAEEVEEPIVPVGPQNIPEPAQLTGPKVIRIERPDHVPRPTPAARSTPRPPRQTPPTMAEDQSSAGESRARGRGVKRVGPGIEAKGLRASPRRGVRDNRLSASEQLREWKERDVLEMRDKLAQATGRGIGGLRAVEKKSRRHRQGINVISSKKDHITLAEPLFIRDFSREAGIPVLDIIKRIQEEQGKTAGINSGIDTDLAQMIAAEYGIELTVVKAKTGLDKLAESFAGIERKHLQPRPPVVTVLGHVDHGKTSLLDRIRRTNVTSSEDGGITQHIGAYRVKVGDKWVTFLDTPGHAAFTAMRARGANVTDVVVLVVAADDGVMPTTIEAINHANAANATIVVALNKIDLVHDVNKLYGQLAEHGLTPSGDWGGEIDVIHTSAETGEGMDTLLAHLATLSDILELKADPTIPAAGTVIESELKERIGNVARVIVQEGTLKTGDVIVCGAAYARIRSMKDDRGDSIKTAGPSTPVEITGLNNVPEAGDPFYAVTVAKQAKEIAAEIADQRRQQELNHVTIPTSLENIFATTEDGDIPELNVIIRADVRGSIDALKQELSAIPDDEVRLKIMHSGIGTVTESDLELAKASHAIIIAFYVVPDPIIQKKADQAGVDIRTYRVIYEVIDDIRLALEGLLAPEEKFESRGRAEVREIFTISKVGKAAGCLVRDGFIHQKHRVRVVRDGVVVADSAAIDSLRRFKDNVKEVKSGFECGIKIANFDDVKPGDIIESFEIVKIARTLQPSS